MLTGKESYQEALDTCPAITPDGAVGCNQQECPGPWVAGEAGGQSIEICGRVGEVALLTQAGGGLGGFRVRVVRRSDALG